VIVALAWNQLDAAANAEFFEHTRALLRKCASFGLPNLVVVTQCDNFRDVGADLRGIAQSTMIRQARAAVHAALEGLVSEGDILFVSTPDGVGRPTTEEFKRKCWALCLDVVDKAQIKGQGLLESTKIGAYVGESVGRESFRRGVPIAAAPVAAPAGAHRGPAQAVAEHRGPAPAVAEHRGLNGRSQNNEVVDYSLLVPIALANAQSGTITIRVMRMMQGNEFRYEAQVNIRAHLQELIRETANANSSLIVRLRRDEPNDTFTCWCTDVGGLADGGIIVNRVRLL
jgi:hypothetical protein